MRHTNSPNLDTVREAEHLMASRAANIEALWKRIDSDDEADRDEAYEELNGYPLSFEYSEEENLVRLIFGTGGPHDELQWHQRPYGAPCDLRYVYLPWFDRHVIGEADVPYALHRLAEHWAEIVGPEFLGLGRESF